MRLFHKFDDEFWENETAMWKLQFKVLLPLFIVILIIFYVSFKGVVPVKKIFFISILYAVTLYVVIAAYYNWPYYAKQKSDPMWLQHLIGYSTALILIIVLYGETIIILGPFYPWLLDYICCDYLQTFYNKSQ